MEINKESFEAMIIFLYKTNNYEACEKLFVVYQQLYFKNDKSNKLKLINSKDFENE